jgi:cation diffusion facilitator CzcD-associated flavoprotein CzcO
MKFNHKVVAANWEEDNGTWHVRIQDERGNEFEDTCDVLINGGGHLKYVSDVQSFFRLHALLHIGGQSIQLNFRLSSNWKWPDIKGLHSFKGVLQHSAHFDETLDLTGKQVAVIGMGSSGIQITANIASKVERLHTWIRSPTWVTAGFAQRYAGTNGENFECLIPLARMFVVQPVNVVRIDSEEQKTLLEMNPDLCLKYSKMVESELNKRFKFMINGTPEAAQARVVRASFSLPRHTLD